MNDRGGGNGGGGGSGQAVFIVMLAILIGILVYNGDAWVNSAAPNTLLAFTAALITALLAFVMNGKYIESFSMVIQPFMVFATSFVFIVLTYYAGPLPTWLSGNIWALGGVFQIITLFWREKLKKMGLDGPEIMFGTMGYLALLTAALNVPWIGKMFYWLAEFIGSAFLKITG
jgi:hypothetical protein